MILEMKGVTKSFGGLVAVKELSLGVEKGEILGLIGPNGAGKTTTFNIINGFYPPDRGRVVFEGRDITGKKPSEICKLGIGRTFQIMKPLKRLTVLDNVIPAAFLRADGFDEAKKKSLEVLRLTGLIGRAESLASELTHADLKRLELSRALATEPKLLLLDEVAAGLNPKEVAEAVDLIRKIRDDLGITIIWVEHVMRAIMSASDRIIVLHHGEKISEGVPEQVASDKKVIEAYLGESRIA
jgi:branched-chain amino acid transport system ATP-binding protein